MVATSRRGKTKRLTNGVCWMETKAHRETGRISHPRPPATLPASLSIKPNLLSNLSSRLAKVPMFTFTGAQRQQGTHFHAQAMVILWHDKMIWEFWLASYYENKNENTGQNLISQWKTRHCPHSSCSISEDTTLSQLNSASTCAISRRLPPPTNLVARILDTAVSSVTACQHRHTHGGQLAAWHHSTISCPLESLDSSNVFLSKLAILSIPLSTSIFLGHQIVIFHGSFSSQTNGFTMSCH